MIPLYILGLLQRYGPQHGYQIKKLITEQMADFTQIKLPTIYYHLEKMQAEGLLFANSEKPGSRPEKTVYWVTDKGTAAFHTMLSDLLTFEYRPTFPADGAFYFSEYLANEDICIHLQAHIRSMEEVLRHLEGHYGETLRYVPKEYSTSVGIIFSHHIKHYQAELNWAKESLQRLSTTEEERQ